MQKYCLKKIASILLIAMVAWIVLPVTPAYAAPTFTSIQSGDWTDSATWDQGSVPDNTNGDSVIIATGHTVTLTADTIVGGSLTINSGATLATNDFRLTLSGGNFINNGTFTAGNSNIDIAGTSNQNIAGFTTTGTVSMIKTLGSTATFTGNVSGSGLTINGLGGTLNLGSGLTHTFSGTWTRTAGDLTGGSSTLNLGKLGVVASGTGGTFAAGTGTVNYNAGGAQTIAALTYNNLTLSESGVKTITTTSTVNGVLSMEGTATAAGTTALVYGPDATLQYNTATSRTAGATEWKTPFTATGGVIIANTGTITMNVAKVFNAGVPLTINSGATLATSNLALTLGGNFTNNGTFTNVNSAITLSGTAATQSIAGFTTNGLVSMTKTGGTATFTGNVSGGGLTINGSGGTLNLGSGLTHAFSGTWTRTNGTLDGGSSTLNLNGALSGTGGTFTADASTVNYGGAAQSVAGVIYNNLSLSGTGVKTLPASLTTVNGDLTISTTAPGSTTTTATLAAALTIGGNLTIGASTTLDVSASNFALNVGGNWANNGTFNPRTATAAVTLQGASAQTISGTSSTTFNNLTINNIGGGVTLSTNATVNGTLTLTNGKVTTGAFSLIVGTAGTAASTSAASYVFGNLQKDFATGAQSFTFDIGDATNYTPVAIAFASVTTAGNVTANTTAGEHPNIGSIVGLDSTKDVNRYWTLTPAGGLVFTTYSATFNFVSGDIDLGATTSNFIVKRYSSGWSSTTTGTQNPTSTQATGIAAMSSFVVGEVDTTVPVISSATSSTTDGSYKAGVLIPITVTFSEAVNVVTTGGTPTLTLETGTPDETVNYASGSGTNALTFNYTVQPGDTSGDLDYVLTTPLALNGGTIKDFANNDASLTLPAPGASGSIGFSKAIVIDTNAPDTTITDQPANPSNSASAAFTFSSADGTASFECSLDAGAYAACTSPKSYISLADGSHTFAVRAKDPAGNVDATPASYTWTIDTTAPDTTITGQPANPSNSASAAFIFSSADGTATFECSLDAGAYAACTSPKSYISLADGSHTFGVRAKDPLGNVDATPASYTWTINTTYYIFLPLVIR